MDIRTHSVGMWTDVHKYLLQQKYKESIPLGSTKKATQLGGLSFLTDEDVVF